MHLEIHGPQGEDLLINDGDFSAPSSSLTAVNNQTPAKRPTRQWAAWTRQEEENFFNALRQVGKNFEKITSRVQSKNKNQVRHYYYRLVRRMNKLLGPGLCLDAKNSKDTIAAMLRWWSLLEKHSCTASKLHLKPRRFKLFIEALESQLLKDRNKSRRKRPCQGEKYLSAASTTSLPSKAPVNDGHQIVDSQNTNKAEATKVSLKRNMSANINFSKEELLPMRPARQKRRPGLIASAAYRRWEKAAMAGVSLVADAAEQLERSTNDGNCSVDHGAFAMLSNRMYNTAGKKDIDSARVNGGHLCSSTQTRMCSHQTGDAVIQPPMKLKLQLFPIDELTRQALEKDACNPHLELTLSGRKRISSVLEHLNRKWGSSSIASGELMLFPYSAQQEDTRQRRWTAKDTISSAADVYATVGSPAVFRLRYGWFSSAEPVMGIVHASSPTTRDITMLSEEDFQEGLNMDVPSREMPNVESPRPVPPSSHISEQPVGSSRDLSAPLSSPSNVLKPLCGDYPAESKDELPCSSQPTPSYLDGEKTRDGYCREQQEVSLSMRNCGTFSAGDWADSLTNISIGDLLSEASQAAKSSCIDSSLGKSAVCPQDDAFSSDSFDAAIAAHISGHQLLRVTTQATPSSMWNAEETCDEFSFKMGPALKTRESPLSHSVEDRRQSAVSASPFHGYLKELTKSGPSNGPACGDLEVESESAKDTSHNRNDEGFSKDASHNKDEDGPLMDSNLMDIYWPDSLGPLDLEMPSSSRYQGEDLVFGDSNSFGCLSRMIANSLDAFQNCSFFGDKKESSTSEAQGPSIHLDTKFS